MPEQAEWRSDSGDYTWRPEYTRRTSTGPSEDYDLRTVGDKVAELQRKIAHLETIVHHYINCSEGTL